MRLSRFAKYILCVCLFSFSAFAENPVSCTQDQKSSLLGKREVCTWKEMSKLSQLSVSSVHCAPTSLVMLISGLVESGVPFKTDSWVDKNYVGKKNKERIKLMGELLQTQKPDGTSGYMTKLKTIELASNFVGAVGSIKLPGQATLNNDFFKTRIKNRFIDLIGYGHYIQKCEKVDKLKICSFTRDGGHAIAVNGYQVKKEKDSIIFYDPWGGFTKKYSIKQTDNKSSALDESGILIDLRPHLNHTTMLYKSFNKYKILDYAVGIQSN